MKSIGGFLVTVPLAFLLCHSALAQSKLPQVDLGYEIHQAIAFNETSQLYNFSNIRFAQPPVGQLRFAAPVPPTGRNNVVQNGSVGAICPQASASWGAIAQQFVPYFLAGNASTFNYTQAQTQLQTTLAQNPNLQFSADPRESEDCLFLDIIVPKAILDSAQSKRRRSAKGGAPVLVWIYGGAYVVGEKSRYNPSGLIKTSQSNGDAGLVYVAMNYRLGAFGFLSGPTLQAAGGVSNAGLHDQRLALEWIQKNIHLFGGDPSQVTIMGESAGGGSIMHQMTAYGGQKPFPFARAIPQSAAWLPMTKPFAQDNVTNWYLKTLNVSTIEEARNASSAAVIRANKAYVGSAEYTDFHFAPVLDGVFSPNLPGIAFLNGQYAKNLSVLVGHNTNESPAFGPPFVRSDKDLAEFFERVFPGISPEPRDYIIKTLYPIVNYPSPVYRVFEIMDEVFFDCQTNYIARAYNNKTWNYRFEVPPALHGNDVQYTFFSGQFSNLTTGTFAPVAQIMQQYITNFAKTGNPNGPGVPFFPVQGNNASMMSFNITTTAGQVVPDVKVTKDGSVNPRCAWWQKALYL